MSSKTWQLAFGKVVVENKSGTHPTSDLSIHDHVCSSSCWSCIYSSWDSDGRYHLLWATAMRKSNQVESCKQKKASGGASIKSKLKAHGPNRDEQAANTQAKLYNAPKRQVTIQRAEQEQPGHTGRVERVHHTPGGTQGLPASRSNRDTQDE